jgi:hypothetical protein
MRPLPTLTLGEIPGRSWSAWHDTGPRNFHGRGSHHAALDLCAACPVRECCFWFALAGGEATDSHHGIWGGTTTAGRERFADSVPSGFAGGTRVQIPVAPPVSSPVTSRARKDFSESLNIRGSGGPILYVRNIRKALWCGRRALPSVVGGRGHERVAS